MIFKGKIPHAGDTGSLLTCADSSTDAITFLLFFFLGGGGLGGKKIYILGAGLRNFLLNNNCGGCWLTNEEPGTDHVISGQ